MLVHQFDRTIVTSPIDKNALEEISSTYYAPSAGLNLRRSSHTQWVDLRVLAMSWAHRKAARIVFLKDELPCQCDGAVHLVRDIMPAVWAERPDAEVWIVAKTRHRKSDCSKQPMSTPSTKARAVVVTGTVPDVNAFCRKHGGSAPLALWRRHSKQGAQRWHVAGCGYTQSHCGTAGKARQDPGDRDRQRLFAVDPAIARKSAQRTELGRRGRQFVEQNHTWSGAACRLEEIYRTTRNNGSPTETNKEPNQKRPQPVLEH